LNAISTPGSCDWLTDYAKRLFNLVTKEIELPLPRLIFCNSYALFIIFKVSLQHNFNEYHLYWDLFFIYCYKVLKKPRKFTGNSREKEQNILIFYLVQVHAWFAWASKWHLPSISFQSIQYSTLHHLRAKLVLYRLFLSSNLSTSLEMHKIF
jgi:hypothetical protein